MVIVAVVTQFVVKKIVVEQLELIQQMYSTLECVLELELDSNQILVSMFVQILVPVINCI